jgi:hypothetical protein
MKLRKWLEKWNMTSLKIGPTFLQADLRWKDADKAAAWEMYIELLTRITTQPLDTEHGDEKTALESVYSLFPTTRQVLKNNTKNCVEFAKLAIVILNQIVRPFTAKWHRLSQQGVFEDPEKKCEFRKELGDVQLELGKYAKMLADMAGVEDLTSLEGE